MKLTANSQQPNNPTFTDKLTGRTITIMRNNKYAERAYLNAFNGLKGINIVRHNTHLTQYCETN